MNKQMIARKITAVLMAALGMLYLCLCQPAYPQTSSNLELQQVIKETVIFHNEGWHPEIVVINNRIFLAFKGIGPRKGFRLVELKEDLSYKGEIFDIFSDSNGRFPTDIRASGDGENLWYVFEAVLGNWGEVDCVSQFVNIVKYDISRPAPKLESTKVNIATGCPSTRAYRNPPAELPENPEIADDPAPFFYNGQYVVLTRAFKGGIQHIRTFDQEFNLIEHFTLDLRSVLNGREPSQNALVNIKGQVYLIGGFFDGPPINLNAHSDIYAIPLTSDLHSVSGEIIPLLKNSSEYFTRVTSAIYDKGKLYINYKKAEKGEGVQFHHLAVFDVGNDFALITKNQFQNISSPASNSDMDILGDKLYVVYEEEHNILAQVFEWKEK